MRIATSLIAQSSIADLQRSQSAIFEASTQTASQNRATDLKGYGREAQTLVSTERLIARIEAQRATNVELQTRLEIQDTALTRAGEVVAQLRQSLFEGVGLDTGVAVEAELNQAFGALKDVFNLNIAGRYVFGGTLNDRPPVLADDLADLAGNPLADAFEQDATAQLVKLDDIRTVEAGPIAADVASDVFDVLRTLQQFNDGPSGPFTDPLTDAQRGALTAEIARLDDVAAGLFLVQADNGRVLKETEDSIIGQDARSAALQQAVQGITDVDLAEVAVRLNQAELSFQASASVFNTLRGLTLLDVI